jgi:hypothetical protein
VIREHFLRQTPRLMLHAASDSSLTLVLDVPDLSLLDGKVRIYRRRYAHRLLDCWCPVVWVFQAVW